VVAVVVIELVQPIQLIPAPFQRFTYGVKYRLQIFRLKVNWRFLHSNYP
jgi:hypothetical protein